ncbi:MAG: transporter [Chitinophagaceae bacterium]
MNLLCHTGQSQDLEPRRYAALPVKTNAIAMIYGLSRGNVVSDAALPISDFKMTTHNLGIGYARTFGLAGKLARVMVSVPFTFMSGKLVINGHDTSGVRNGFNDAQVRLGVNLTGSPAVTRQHFATYQQKTIFGVSLVINVPSGLYHKNKFINTGTNRWAFKPEIGVSKRFKRVYAEVYSGVWFYLHNNEYLGNKKLAQHPMFSIQGHACYYLKHQMWISVDGTWFNGGQTYVNNVAEGDLFDNWRVGGTWSFPVAKAHSLKLQFHVGAFATRGYNYNTISLAYQFVFF